jgi:sugar phosphate isomerase/epimerase
VIISTQITSFRTPFEQAVHRVAQLGFAYVDVVALAERPTSHREALAETDLVVSCAAIGCDLPYESALNAESIEQRLAALSVAKRQINDAAALGATVCYVTAGNNDSREALLGYGDTCVMLAEHARQRMMRLCVEPVPGHALPTAASVLDWLAAVRHPNLYLLLNVSQCRLAQERPHEIIAQSRDRLGYVRLNVHSGERPHRPDELAHIVSTLQDSGYGGGICLDFNSESPQAEMSLRESRELLASLVKAKP